MILIAPSPSVPRPTIEVLEKNRPAAKSYRPTDRRNPKSILRKGRISADLIVDQEHLDRKETAKSLSSIAMIVLAISTCLAVAWFLKDWVGK